MRATSDPRASQIFKDRTMWQTRWYFGLNLYRRHCFLYASVAHFAYASLRGNAKLLDDPIFLPCRGLTGGKSRFLDDLNILPFQGCMDSLVEICTKLVRATFTSMPCLRAIRRFSPRRKIPEHRQMRKKALAANMYRSIQATGPYDALERDQRLFLAYLLRG